MRCLAASVVAASVLVSAGVSAQGVFDEAVKAAADLPRLHSLVVSQAGQVTLERYFNGRKAASLSNVKSVSKSVIAALVGIAVDRKQLSLDDADCDLLSGSTRHET